MEARAHLTQRAQTPHPVPAPHTGRSRDAGGSQLGLTGPAPPAGGPPGPGPQVADGPRSPSRESEPFTTRPLMQPPALACHPTSSCQVPMVAGCRPHGSRVPMSEPREGATWMLSRWRCLSRQEQAWVGGSCRGQPLPAPSTGLVGTRECLGTGLAYKPEGQRVPRRLLTCPREEARPRGRGRHPQWAWPGGLGGARRRPTRQRGDTLPLPGFSELWVSWAWGCPAAPRLTP